MNIINSDLKFNGTLKTRKTTARIILHHSASKTCTIEQVHKWHLQRGWSGCGYHYLVRKDGKIYQGRPINVQGAHASGNNFDSVGICFEGNFENEKMSDKQIEAGCKLVAFIKNQYGINKVQRHKDVCPTACPGNNFPYEKIVNPVKSDGVYLVKVLAGTLNVRAGAGVKYRVVTKVKKDEVYTIVEEKLNGSTKWGLLKAYQKTKGGWISLKYTKKL